MLQLPLLPRPEEERRVVSNIGQATLEEIHIGTPLSLLLYGVFLPLLL